MRPLIIKLAQRVMLVKNSQAPERFFALVTNQMGPTGIDILFELETTRGSSLGAARASEFLRDPAVRRRGTAALQIAYEVRHTRNCEELLPLLDRAQADGEEVERQRTGRPSCFAASRSGPPPVTPPGR